MPEAKIRTGVLGCGAIAQMMHLPYLQRHRDIFDLVRVVDLSPTLARSCADRFRAAGWSSEAGALLADDIDAVIVATSGSHGAAATALAAAGKHLLVEKPLCFTARETRDIAAARDETGVVVQVGYMKRYDPAFRRARAMLAAGPAPRLLEVTVLHPRERRYTEHHSIDRAADLPAESPAELRSVGRELAREALGERPEWALDMYTDVLLGSLVHDVNVSRHLVGEPRAVSSASCWHDGRAITATLAYDGDLAARMTWCWFDDDLDYQEAVGVHADGWRLDLRFPSPYLEHAATSLEVRGHDGHAITATRFDHGHAEAFEEELLHFAQCVRSGSQPLTTVEDAGRDLALLHAIAIAALDGVPVVLPVG